MTALDELAELARDYCAVVDGAEELGRDAFLETVEPRVARLYAAGAELGDPFAFDYTDDYAAPRPVDRRSLFWRLSDFLGEAGRLEEPVETSLADDLAHIYADLRSGLAALEEGHPGDAGYELSFGFRHHWGAHAWQALAAIHSHRSGPSG